MIVVDRNFLKQFALFENFENEDFDSILGMMIERTYGKGNTIIVENELGSEVFLLLEGEIEITQRMTLDNTSAQDDERNKALARLSAEMNIVVGETSLFDEGRRTATVTAVSDVTVGCISRNDLLRHCVHRPEFGYRIFYNLGKILSKRLANANINMLKISTAFVLALERGR